MSSSAGNPALGSASRTSKKRNHQTFAEDHPDSLTAARLQDVENQRRELLRALVGSFSRTTLDQLLIEAALNNPTVMEATLATKYENYMVSPVSKLPDANFSQYIPVIQQAAPTAQRLPTAVVFHTRTKSSIPKSYYSEPTEVRKKLPTQRSQAVPSNGRSIPASYIRGQSSDGDKVFGSGEAGIEVKEKVEDQEKLVPSSNRVVKVIARRRSIGMKKPLSGTSIGWEILKINSRISPGGQAPEVTSRSCTACRAVRKSCDRRLPCTRCASRDEADECSYPANTRLREAPHVATPKPDEAPHPPTRTRSSRLSRLPTSQLEQDAGFESPARSHSRRSRQSIISSPKPEAPESNTADKIADITCPLGTNRAPNLDTPEGVSNQFSVTEEASLIPEKAPEVLVSQKSEILNSEQPDSGLQVESLDQGYGIDEQPTPHSSPEATLPSMEDKETSLDTPVPEVPPLNTREVVEGDVDDTELIPTEKDTPVPVLPPLNTRGAAEENVNDTKSRATEKEPADKSVSEPTPDISSNGESIPEKTTEKEPKEVFREWEQTDQENKIGETASPPIKSPNVMVVIYQ